MPQYCPPPAGNTRSLLFLGCLDCLDCLLNVRGPVSPCPRSECTFAVSPYLIVLSQLPTPPTDGLPAPYFYPELSLTYLPPPALEGIKVMPWPPPSCAPSLHHAHLTSRLCVLCLYCPTLHHVSPCPAALEDIKAMPYLRACLGESLRLYPQPPILIRRALGEDTLPPGLRGDPAGYPIGKGADLFISVWNLHR